MKEERILVVDDDIALCELVRAALELEGIAVDEAHHVVEADRLLHERLPDAIVLDIGLPGIDGLFYCARLRENPQTQRPADHRDQRLRERTASRRSPAGATAFVQKPFDPLELLTLLERTIGVTPLGHAFGPGVSDEVDDRERWPSSAGCSRSAAAATSSSSRAYRQTLAAIAASLEIRGLDTSAHTEARDRLRDAAHRRGRAVAVATTRASSGASCSTTSATSASPTGSCSSAGR